MKSKKVRYMGSYITVRNRPTTPGTKAFVQHPNKSIPARVHILFTYYGTPEGDIIEQIETEVIFLGWTDRSLNMLS